MFRKTLTHRSALLGAGLLAAGIALTGSSSSQAAVDTATPGAFSLTRPIPAAVAVPAGHKVSSSFAAQGVQVYQCTAGAWTLLEPAATLVGQSISKRGLQTAVHFRGPSWESSTDGSLVTAAAVATSPVAGSIPEVLLKAATNRGTGIFGKVSYVQRLATTGGTAPAGSCTDGQTTGVSYTAKYRFYTAG